jgi:hypothetical protein
LQNPRRWRLAREIIQRFLKPSVMKSERRAIRDVKISGPIRASRGLKNRHALAGSFCAGTGLPYKRRELVISPDVANHADRLLDLANDVIIGERPCPANGENRATTSNGKLPQTEVSRGKQRTNDLKG